MGVLFWAQLMPEVSDAVQPHGNDRTRALLSLCDEALDDPQPRTRPSS